MTETALWNVTPQKEFQCSEEQVHTYILHNHDASTDGTTSEFETKILSYTFFS